MRDPLRLVLALIPFVLHAQSQAPSPIPTPSAASIPPDGQGEDLVLQSLLEEAQAKNPDLARTQALVAAEKERIPQARALPDPSLSLGIQNDSFKSIQVGKMETSWYTAMVTQPLPWPGKRKLREAVAGLGADITNVAVERARLSLQADVSRAYYGLLLVRGQQRLLEDQAIFLKNALAITQARYEVGQGSQADILRAQLELSRLDQNRYSLQSEDRVFVATLNRLRGTTEDSPIPTTASLEQMRFQIASVESALALAEARSPELQAARLGVKQAEVGLDLAKRDRYPDFAVSGGVMPRGALEPMWTVGFSIALPLWSKQKQQRAVAEQDWRRKSQGSEAANVRNLLNQRTRERAAQFESALGTLRIYRDGLLVQSEAAFHANLAQYETGRVPFLSVLEALNGWVADRSGLLQAVAQAKAIQIANEELNLAGTPAISAQGLAAGSLGMGGTPGGAAMSGQAKTGSIPMKRSNSEPSKSM